MKRVIAQGHKAVDGDIDQTAEDRMVGAVLLDLVNVRSLLRPGDSDRLVMKTDKGNFALFIYNGMSADRVKRVDFKRNPPPPPKLTPTGRIASVQPPQPKPVIQQIKSKFKGSYEEPAEPWELSDGEPPENATTLSQKVAFTITTTTGVLTFDVVDEIAKDNGHFLCVGWEQIEL